MSRDDLLEELKAREERARAMGGAQRLARREAEGVMNARSRITQVRRHRPAPDEQLAHHILTETSIMATTEVTSEIIGSVWKIEKSEGDSVTAGETIMILESMKMEIPVEAPVTGRLVQITVEPEDSVDEDQVLCRIES